MQHLKKGVALASRLDQQVKRMDMIGQETRLSVPCATLPHPNPVGENNGSLFGRIGMLCHPRFFLFHIMIWAKVKARRYLVGQSRELR